VQLISQEESDIKVIEFMNMDLKGYFPASLLNMGMATMAQQNSVGWYRKMKEIKEQEAK